MKNTGIIALMLATVCFVGCSGDPSDQPELAVVRGTVTLDGEPLTDAEILFSPEGGGQSSDAMSDDTGNYELRYKRETMGAMIGTHTVSVSLAEDEDIDEETGEWIGGGEKVPAKYNSESQYTQTVEPGENVIDLQLTSD